MSEQPVQHLEQVSIEAVHVGDYVYVEREGRAPLGDTLRVIAKATIRRAPSDRVAGWRLEFATGDGAWWPRDAIIWRRRARSASREPPVGVMERMCRRTRSGTSSRTAGVINKRGASIMPNDPNKPVDKIRDTVRDTTRDVKERIKEGAEKGKDAAENLGDKARDMARDAGETVKDAAQKVRDTVRDAGHDIKKKID